ncbi:hypothetical protein [Hymenobacter latericus]|uniref:hypothetical protein n=1 Tax=Hymenobacter sp. YIM 151858-1 TaxID=2987688 RepID=UPI002227AE69|nr:hypothetical protein [Hymenobacter sp. YIM 151858-1]UYZ61277.1 hypothetical protein OIS50_20100 [Hymenobacter sp. YIM 151858-1]
MGSANKTPEQRKRMVDQSLGITQSQGPYQEPEWLVEQHARYIAGQLDLATLGARYDEKLKSISR